MVTPDVSIARPQTAAMMSKYRYNRIVLTTLFLLMTASGLHLILFTSDLPRSAGVLLTTTGAAVPVWVFLGANRDMRRKQVAVLSGLETLQRSIRNLPTTATLADGQHHLADQLLAEYDDLGSSSRATLEELTVVKTTLDSIESRVDSIAALVDSVSEGVTSGSSQLRWVAGSGERYRYELMLRLDQLARALVELADHHDRLAKQISASSGKPDI